MYDELSALYDLFVDWPSRLRNEMPLLEKLGVGVPGQRIVDVACGTGHHALAWAEKGCTVRAFDASREMVEQARMRDRAGLVNWRVAGFTDIPKDGWADALVCLGTSLPHAESEAAHRGALAPFAGALKPGGVLVVHSRNLARTAGGGEAERFLPPLSRKRDGRNVLFWRFYDILSPSLLDFHLVVLEETPEKWTHRVLTSRLCVVPAEQLVAMGEEAEFRELRVLGSLDGRPYDRENSPDLVLAAKRS